MASALEYNKFLSNNKVNVDTDSGSMATAAAVLFNDLGGIGLDMREFECAAFVVHMKTAGDALSLVEIIGSASSAMTSPTVIKSFSSAAVTAVDAAGDYFVCEVGAEQLKTTAGAALRYATVRLTAAGATARCVTVAIRSGAREAKDGLTASYAA